jgi:hypothetical protein
VGDTHNTVLAAETLALGIGATKVLFARANTILLAPLPYREGAALLRFADAIGARLYGDGPIADRCSDESAKLATPHNQYSLTGCITADSYIELRSSATFRVRDYQARCLPKVQEIPMAGRMLERDPQGVAQEVG